MSQPPYLQIAQRKRAQLDSRIPPEWKLPAHLIPSSRDANRPVNVMDIPRQSGLLTSDELRITENWNVRNLLTQMRQGKLSAENVARAFSKVGASAHGLYIRQLHNTLLKCTS